MSSCENFKLNYMIPFRPKVPLSIAFSFHNCSFLCAPRASSKQEDLKWVLFNNHKWIWFYVWVLCKGKLIWIRNCMRENVQNIIQHWLVISDAIVSMLLFPESLDFWRFPNSNWLLTSSWGVTTHLNVQFLHN